MAESSSGPGDTRRQLAEASALLVAADDRRATLGSNQSPQIRILGRVIARLQPQATTPVTTSLTESDTQDLSDQDICRRLQAQRVALSLLGRSLPVPQQLLFQIGPASSHLSRALLQVGSVREVSVMRLNTRLWKVSGFITRLSS